MNIQLNISLSPLSRHLCISIYITVWYTATTMRTNEWTKNRQFMTFNPQKSMCTLLLAIYHKRQSAFLYICVNSELPIKIFILYIFTYTLSMNAIMQYLYVCWWMREFLCVQLLPFIMIVLHTVTFNWITVHENVSLKKI